jgi:hypothetical protein
MGLVHPSEVLEPYEMTLTEVRRAERREWSVEVLVSIDERIAPNPGDVVEIHAGSDYRDFGLLRRVEDSRLRHCQPVRGDGDRTAASAVQTSATPLIPPSRSNRIISGHILLMMTSIDRVPAGSPAGGQLARTTGRRGRVELTDGEASPRRWGYQCARCGETLGSYREAAAHSLELGHLILYDELRDP